jgi:outer membrane protein assembly factor BamD (BamD/ComL family)
VVPQSDQALGVDAEIRVALFELLEDRHVPALYRLQWLASSPVAVTEANAARALRGRQDLLFLLTESYYRVGMGEPFRQSAQQLLASGSAGRYAAIVQARLLLDAYRRGDYARATELARALSGADAAPEMRGLASLVTGLAAYQQRDFAGARTAFAAAQQAGAPYADYARYMDALTTLRGDTTQTGAVLTALQSVASSASGEFADQVRLTAAMLAYEGEQYDEAARLAGTIDAGSGLAAQALLTRAWALYKANQIAPAGEAFAQFATRYPQLPARDEARLMSAQVLLQLGRTAEAATVFKTVADSTGAEVSALQARSRSALSEGARALVAARAAGLLFLTDPASGKTIALQDATAADRAVLLASFADTTATAGGQIAVPDVVTLSDIEPRLASVRSATAATVPHRVFYTPASASLNRGDYAQRSQLLADADVAVALARFAVDEQVASQARQIVLLRAMQQLLRTQTDSFTAMAGRLQVVQDSLTRMASALDAAAERIRGMLQSQVELTRQYAEENTRMIDSVRGSLAGAGETEQIVLNYESQTAVAYRQVAQMLSGNIDRAVGNHPVLRQRDSLRARGTMLASLLGETRGLLAGAQQIVDQELARLEAGETEQVRGARARLAAVESQRASAEARLIALVDQELNARAGEMIAELRRDTEAAVFGKASAAFFEALDAGRTQGSAGTGGTGTGVAGGAPAEPAAQPQSQK